MRYLFCGILLCAALGWTETAVAGSTDWDLCRDITNKDKVDQGLAACDRILNDPGQAKNFAMALRNRCGINETKGDYDQALADCERAIRLEPDSSIAYERRGRVWGLKGNADRAIQDVSQAIKLDPKNAYAYCYRAFQMRSKGDTAAGDADHARARQLNPDASNWGCK